MKKILAIHLGHDGSITYVENNEIIFHTQIDRYLRVKHNITFNMEILEILSNLDFDVLIINSLTNSNNAISYFANQSKEFFPLRNKISKARVVLNADKNHHFTHAACLKTFTNDLEEIIVADGCGSCIVAPDGKNFFEQESIFINKENNLKRKAIQGERIGKCYENRSNQIFGPGLKSSKLMSLYQYGRFKKDYYNNHDLNLTDYLKSYAPIPKVTPQDQNIFDLAYTTQKYTEDKIFEFFEHSHSEKIGFTGGVAQNVILNSKLKNKYKNLVIDPMCGDMGISLGAANIETGYKLKRKSIYLGIKQYLDLEGCPFKYKKVNYSDVCKVVYNDPVGIFQSRSEQGQRGLGNRSLLMNADHSDCRSKMNKIKKREWYRPFALSILEENADEYFENCFYSPHMMYIFKLKNKFRSKLKDGFAVDYTSRIQTVNQKDNFHYYNLLKEYKNIYNAPYLLNTSLNMPGHVLVEKLEDLYKMMKETNLNYAYLPEKQILIYKCQ